MSSAASHAFVPHLWKKGACRECALTEAEHTTAAKSSGAAASAQPTVHASSPLKHLHPSATKPTNTAANASSPPPMRAATIVTTATSSAATAASASESNGGGGVGSIGTGRVAALAKRTSMIHTGATVPAATAAAAASTIAAKPASNGVGSSAQPTTSSGASASAAKSVPPSLPSTVGTAMTVAAAANAFRRPLAAKMPPPLPSVIAAGATNAAAASTAANTAAGASTAALSVPERPVPVLPSSPSSGKQSPSSDAAAAALLLPPPDRPVPALRAATANPAARAVSPIPERPVPPLPSASSATTPAVTLPARSSPPPNASPRSSVLPPPTRKPPAAPTRAPPKAPTAAAATVAEPPSPVSPAASSPSVAGPPTLSRAVSAGPPRMPPPLSSVVTPTAAAASTPVPPVPSSSTTAAAPASSTPVIARAPPPLHAVVAAVPPPPPPPPATASSPQQIRPPPLPTPAVATGPPPLPTIAESTAVPRIGPPPLNLPASAASAAVPPPLPASVAASKRAAVPNTGTTATRLVDYFCVFGRGALFLDAHDPDFPPPPRAYPDANAASAAAWASLRFHPMLLTGQRYPSFDHRDSALSGNTASFAFPSYISALLVPHKQVDDPYADSWVARRPRLHRFTLTKLDGTKQFCSSLTFWERVGTEKEVLGLLAEIEAALRGWILKPGMQSKEVNIDLLLNELRNGACARTIAPAPPPSAAVATAAAVSAAAASKSTRPPPPPPPPPPSRTLPPSCALFVPKSLTVVSSWPFFSLWEEFLKAFFRLSHVGLSQSSIRKFAACASAIKGGGSSSAGASTIESAPEQFSILSLPLPLERMLVNFLCEIPVPPPGVLQVRYYLPGSTLSFPGNSNGASGSGADANRGALLISRPPINQLPLCDINWHLLFRAVDPGSFVAIFVAVATEQKVLLVSKHANLITAVCDAVAVLLFPLSWQGVFMPLLPEPMLEFLYAPVPFIAGMDASTFSRHFGEGGGGDIDLPDELVLVELDASPAIRIRIPAEESIPRLPENIYSKLLAHLRAHAAIHNPKHPFVGISDQAFPFGQEQDRIEIQTTTTTTTTTTTKNAPAANGNSAVSPPPPPLVPAAYQALSTAFEPTQTYIPIQQAQMQRRGSYPPSAARVAAATGSIGNPTIVSPSSTSSHTSDSASPVASTTSSLETLAGTSSAVDGGVELDVEQVRAGFLKLWCKLLKSYQKFMPWGVHASAPAPTNAPSSTATTPSSSNNVSSGGSSPPHSPTLSPASSPGSNNSSASEVWFNTSGFLAHAPRDARPFLTQLCRSQLFAKFIDDRILVRGDIEAWQASPAHPAYQAKGGNGQKRGGVSITPSSPSSAAFSTTSMMTPSTTATTPSHRSRVSNLSSGGAVGSVVEEGDSDSDHEQEGARQNHHSTASPDDGDEPDEYANAEPSQSSYGHSKTRSVSSMGGVSRSGVHSRQSSTLPIMDDDECVPSTVCPPSFLSAQLDARDPTLMPVLAQVQFFDECILAHKNSRMAKGVRGVLHKGDWHATPFLHDTSHSVARVEDTLHPSAEGLPAGSAPFGYPLLKVTEVSLPAKSQPQGLQAAAAVYPVFPTLDAALFGQPRAIPMLSTEKAALAAAANEMAPELRAAFALPPPLPTSAAASNKDDSGRAVRFAADTPDSPPASPRAAPGSSHPAYSRATPASLKAVHRGSFIAFRARAPSGMQSHIAELANLLSFESFAANAPPSLTSAASSAATAAAVTPSSAASASSTTPVAIGNKSLHKLMEKERLKQEKKRKKAEAAARKDEAAAVAAKKHVTWTPPVYSSSQSVQSAAAMKGAQYTPSSQQHQGPSPLIRSGTVIGRGRAGSSIFSFSDDSGLEAIGKSSSGTSGKSVSFAAAPLVSSSGSFSASTPKSQPTATKGPAVKSKFGTMTAATSSSGSISGGSFSGSHMDSNDIVVGKEISAPIMLPVETMPSVMQAQAQRGGGGAQQHQSVLPPPLPFGVTGNSPSSVSPPVLPPPLPVGSAAVSPPARMHSNAASSSSPAAASSAVSPPRLPPPITSAASSSTVPPPLPTADDSSLPRPPPRRSSLISPPPLPASAAALAAAAGPRKPPPPIVR